MKTIYLFLLGFIPLLSPLAAEEREPTPSSQNGLAKNVILMIGDGMGINTLAVARAYSIGADGKLQVEQMPHTALCKTHSEDSSVPDSASSASALASGYKYINKSINTPTEGGNPSLISYLAKKSGRSVGIVTTTSLTDATPAAFYGFVRERTMEAELASQLSSSGFDLVLGGGLSYFLPKSSPESKRKDEENLLKETEQNGWTLLQNREDLSKTKEASTSTRFLGLFTLNNFGYADERIKEEHSREPSLSEMSLAAVRHLSRNPNGYFLMIEGGMIDKAAHQNWGWRTIQETIEFDKTIGAILQETGPDTLIIVTADHETSGFTLSGYPGLDKKGNDLLARQTDQSFWISWISGPGGNPKGQKETFLDPQFRQPAGHYLPSGSHTGTDVLIAAKGPGSETVHGFLDNTDVFKIMLNAMDLKKIQD